MVPSSSATGQERNEESSHDLTRHCRFASEWWRSWAWRAVRRPTIKPGQPGPAPGETNADPAKPGGRLENDPAKTPTTKAKLEKATFGSGCFWCGEAVFERIPGVKSVVSGYAGGNVPNPTYEMVSTGETGHAEVFQIAFDPAVVSYDKLLKVFWASHDPTTPNQQGPDFGTQYRSVIFYHNEAQKLAAQKSYQELTAKGVFFGPIVTQLVPMTAFYPAEAYHQDYYRRHKGAHVLPDVHRPQAQEAASHQMRGHPASVCGPPKGRGRASTSHNIRGCVWTRTCIGSSEGSRGGGGLDSRGRFRGPAMQRGRGGASCCPGEGGRPLALCTAGPRKRPSMTNSETPRRTPPSAATGVPPPSRGRERPGQQKRPHPRGESRGRGHVTRATYRS